jgi:hypothetical protein
MSILAIPPVCNPIPPVFLCPLFSASTPTHHAYTALANPARYSIVGAHVNTLGSEFGSCFLYFGHQFLVRLGYIVEGEDSPAKLEKEVCAEGDECPKGELQRVSLYATRRGQARSYHGNNLLLNLVRKGHELHEYREVHLEPVSQGVDKSKGGFGRTEVRSIAMLMVCWARVMVAVL